MDGASAVRGPAFSARQWELQHAAWLESAADPLSARTGLQLEMTRAVIASFARQVDSPELALAVAEELQASLGNCDDLVFDEAPASLAYLLWHQVDRYHRTFEALDLLFEKGALPLAKPSRPLRMLEVGSGPAPAGYAVVDYYAALATWSSQQAVSEGPSAFAVVHTLDRGDYWDRIIHQLSEHLVWRPERSSVGRFFQRTYEDLAGFDVRHLHNQAQTAARRAREDPDSDAMIDWFDEPAVDQPVGWANIPPSAYDLIVVSNFLTNRQILEGLADELQRLARSLVPGGVLLTMSGTSPAYRQLWSTFSSFPSVQQLTRVVDTEVIAHDGRYLEAARATRAGHVACLRHLEFLAPSVLEGRIPPYASEWLVDPAAELKYPKFAVRAYRNGLWPSTSRTER